jgi:hypothetical protein
VENKTTFSAARGTALFTNSFFFSVVSLLVTILVGRGYDVQKDERRIRAEIARI